MTAHPKKDVAKAIKRAVLRGWSLTEIHTGHRWGRLDCPANECSVNVWSTPKSPSEHAKQISRRVDRCPHTQEEEP